MGDKPSEVDCAIFGMLAQLKWHFVNTRLEKMFKGKDGVDSYLAFLLSPHCRVLPCV